jgi:hypothetical protein
MMDVKTGMTWSQELTCPGWGIKKNDGWGEFRYIARTFAIVTMYPQYNNNNNNERSHMEPPELGKDN